MSQWALLAFCVGSIRTKGSSYTNGRQVFGKVLVMDCKVCPYCNYCRPKRRTDFKNVQANGFIRVNDLVSSNGCGTWVRLRRAHRLSYKGYVMYDVKNYIHKEKISVSIIVSFRRKFGLPKTNLVQQKKIKHYRKYGTSARVSFPTLSQGNSKTEM